ncbi:MAG: rod shape-determining protein MreC [Prevotellaceae bacterium]|jgi:rod shape-determining protein MreC|nr:rod shape-determining protein MreC [Prevotellaceae bacterium]
MRHLLEFLWKYNYFFVFVCLEVVSVGLLVRFNHYQQGVFFSSANRFTGGIYQLTNSVVSYFHLRTVNEELLEQNLYLTAEVEQLRERLIEHYDDSLWRSEMSTLLSEDYQITRAHVIGNSINLPDNYLTLDKGTADGIGEDMGVVDGKGIVGIVYLSSSHYSIVISLLNGKSNISCKLKNSGHFGYLQWDGNDSHYAYLRDLPRHAEFHRGDTVVTSGYSAIFPAGLPVGTIDDIAESNDGFSYLLKVKLAADLARVDNVRVIARKGAVEQSELKQRISSK